MKFEIDDRTGMILGYEKRHQEDDIDLLLGFPLETDQKMLEQILQAVKKTKEILEKKK